MRTRRTSSKFVPAGFAVLAALVSIGTAQARIAILHAFTGRHGDGAYPIGGLIADKAGNLYGTTSWCGKHGQGTVFKLAPDGTETVLHSFWDGDGDGAYPYARLIRDKTGVLYGTTTSGGARDWGTVFSLAPDGTEKILFGFGRYTDGVDPEAGVIEDRQGNIFGTTALGGDHPCDGYKTCGTVFSLAPDGTETVLHDFAGSKDDGRLPSSGLIEDGAGNLYGETARGGAHGAGIVFTLAPDGAETALHDFGGGRDGANPAGGLIADKSGNLVGTTGGGGAYADGIVFSLAPDGSETVLYSFRGGRDGADPGGALVADEASNLFGATLGGGKYGLGTVFKLAADGRETVLHQFVGGRDGAIPKGGLIEDRHGNLYGTTQGGGGAGCSFENGCGTVFKISSGK